MGGGGTLDRSEGATPLPPLFGVKGAPPLHPNIGEKGNGHAAARKIGWCIFEEIQHHKNPIVTSITLYHNVKQMCVFHARIKHNSVV